MKHSGEKMRKINIVILVIAALAIGAYFGSQAVMKKQFISEINKIGRSAGFKTDVTYESCTISPITLNGKLKQAVLSDGEYFFSAETFEMNLRNFESDISNIRLQDKEQSVTIDNVKITEYIMDGQMPKSTHIFVTGFKSPVGTNPDIEKVLGAKDIVMDMEIETFADYEKKLYEYKKLNANVHDMLDMKMSLTFGGMDIRKYSEFDASDPEVLNNNPEFNNQVREDFKNLTINRMNLTLTDQGVVGKILSSLSGETDTPAKKEVIEMLDNASVSAKSDFERKLTGDLKTFIAEDKKVLTVSLSPKKPVNVQDIMFSVIMGSETDEIISTLGLSYEMR
jgi:hypothetical protein